MPDANTRLLEVSDVSVPVPGSGPATRWWSRGATQLPTVVHEANLSLETGKTLALVGRNGCGKTTLTRAIMNLIPTSGGTIKVRGRQVANLSPRELGRLVSLIPQNSGAALNSRHTVAQILWLPLRLRTQVSAWQRESAIADLLRSVEVDPQLATRYPRQLSAGQQQRVNIARAIAGSPPLILADEPLAALDPPLHRAMLRLLSKLQRERGLGYVLVTHDMNVARAFSDTIAVMDHGRIVETGPADDLMDNPQHPATVQLLAAANACDIRSLW